MSEVVGQARKWEGKARWARERCRTHCISMSQAVVEGERGFKAPATNDEKINLPLKIRYILVVVLRANVNNFGK